MFEAVMRGKVTRIDPVGVYVEVPALGAGLEYGPLEQMTDVVLAVGDRVVVGAVANVAEDYVVLAKMGNAPVDASPAVHDHNSLYYTEAEMDALLAGKSAAGHLHDDRYFTETEVNILLDGKLNAAAITPKPATDRPETYPLGLSYFDCGADASWPATLCLIETIFISVHRTRQTAYEKTTGRTWVRTADAGLTNGWSSWVETRSVADADALYVPRIAKGNAASRHARDLVVWEGGGSLTGHLVIQTNMDFGSHMTQVRVRGYIYQFDQNSLDLDIGFYAYLNGGSPAFTRTGFINNGTFMASEVRLMRRTTDSKVAIVITSGHSGIWQYPKIAIDGIFGQVAVADSELQGWSASVTTDLSALTVMSTVPPADSRTVRVVHGSTSSTARPNAKYVEWIGSATPTNMTADDTWVNTAL